MNKPDYMTETEWNNFVQVIEKEISNALVTALARISQNDWQMFVSRCFERRFFCSFETYEQIKMDEDLRDQFKEYMNFLLI